MHSFEFNEIAYSPEIAAQMLKRQQAVALVQARHKIVEGAVDTAWGPCLLRVVMYLYHV